VLVRGAEHPAAFVVDRVAEILHAPEEALAPVQQHDCLNDCKDAELLLACIHVLSSEQLLLQEERLHHLEAPSP
jgi:hypothetical protein